MIYVLDGQWDFKLVMSVYGALCFDGYMPDSIVVGIAAGGVDPDHEALRVVDYTPAAIAGDDSGDAERFLAFLSNELMPFVARRYRTDQGDRTLIGSSRGWLFVLYAMFMTLNDSRATRDVRRSYVRRVLPDTAYRWLYPDGTGWDAPIVGEPRQAPPVPGPDVLKLSVGLLGGAKAHHLDLLELVLADHAARVLSVRACLGPETRRVGDVTNRQLVSIENDVRCEIRNRHLGRRDQVERRLVGRLELVFLELGQLPCSEQRRRLHEIRHVGQRRLMRHVGR